jgi:hypothetical protein
MTAAVAAGVAQGAMAEGIAAGSGSSLDAVTGVDPAGSGTGGGAGAVCSGGTGGAGDQPLHGLSGAASAGESWLTDETGIAPTETLRLDPTDRATEPALDGWRVHADGSGPPIGGT